MYVINTKRSSCIFYEKRFVIMDLLLRNLTAENL